MSGEHRTQSIDEGTGEIQSREWKTSLTMMRQEYCQMLHWREHGTWVEIRGSVGCLPLTSKHCGPWGRPLIFQGLSALYNLMCWMRLPQYFCNTGVDLWFFNTIFFFFLQMWTSFFQSNVYWDFHYIKKIKNRSCLVESMMKSSRVSSPRGASSCHSPWVAAQTLPQNLFMENTV